MPRRGPSLSYAVAGLLALAWLEALTPGLPATAALVLADSERAEASEAAPRPPPRPERPAPPPSPPAAAAPPRCPDDMVLVGATCIDRYEAHLVDAAGERHPHQLRPRSHVRYRAVSNAGSWPQGYLARTDAAAACAEAGKRLCRRSEWLRACMGAEERSYPYGEVAEPGRCNTSRDHLMRRLFGPDPADWTAQAFNSPKLNLEPGFLARTGKSDCATPEGVHDLVGNLHEWVADEADEAVLADMRRDGESRREQPWRRGNGVFMGGFFSTRGELGNGCRYTTVAHAPRYHDYSTGFRCCADPHTR